MNYDQFRTVWHEALAEAGLMPLPPRPSEAIDLEWFSRTYKITVNLGGTQRAAPFYVTATLAWRWEATLAARSASKSTDKPAVAENETFHYLLVYRADDTAHTVVISDTVPVATTVITATGSKSPAPSVVGQLVNWAVPVASQETVTLTIEARGVITTFVTNTATFSSPQQLLSDSVQVMVYADQIYLPVVLK